MKKIICFVMMSCAIPLAFTVFADDISKTLATMVDFNVVVNNEKVEARDEIYVINDKTYVPLRSIAEILDTYVNWDDETQTIFIEKNKDSIELFPFKADNLYGYIDKYGKVVIEPQFEYAGDFSEGLACVGQSKSRNWGMSGLSTMTYGYINTTGKLVIPYISERERDFHDGLVATWEYDSNDKAYFMNKKGENVLEKYYYDVKDFSDGYAAVLLNNTAKNPHRVRTNEPQQWTFINTNGEECGMVFNSVTSFVDGVSIVEKDGETYAINTSFEPIFRSDYTLVSYNGNDRYIAKDSDTDKYGVVDSKGNIIIDFNYSYIHYSDGMYKVGTDDKTYGFINKYGTTVVEPQMGQFVIDFIGGMGIMGDNAVINRKGEVVLDASGYDIVLPCSTDILYFYKEDNGKKYEGYIDKYGNVLIINEVEGLSDE
ncbi:MAG: WG repeat-containing protein [Clostridia bacterium]|nr:WG repeat-containing protein [Clostridia bacterium]